MIVITGRSDYQILGPFYRLPKFNVDLSHEYCFHVQTKIPHSVFVKSTYGTRSGIWWPPCLSYDFFMMVFSLQFLSFDVLIKMLIIKKKKNLDKLLKTLFSMTKNLTNNGNCKVFDCGCLQFNLQKYDN